MKRSRGRYEVREIVFEGQIRYVVWDLLDDAPGVGWYYLHRDFAEGVAQKLNEE